MKKFKMLLLLIILLFIAMALSAQSSYIITKDSSIIKTQSITGEQIKEAISSPGTLVYIDHPQIQNFETIGIFHYQYEYTQEEAMVANSSGEISFKTKKRIAPSGKKFSFYILLISISMALIFILMLKHKTFSSRINKQLYWASILLLILPYFMALVTLGSYLIAISIVLTVLLATALAIFITQKTIGKPIYWILSGVFYIMAIIDIILWYTF